MMAPSLTYYNDNDARCCAWLRELIADGLLPNGHVDERPIQDVRADDLVGYSQCHFFAGIGGWPHALRLAGVPESENVWTGSCPCQPFSIAGKRNGTTDERHVWPEFARLIGECRPATVFGEQVASRDGREWLAGVFADLEAVGYAVAGADLCAASVGAPHIRQRLYWVGHTGYNTGGSLFGVEREILCAGIGESSSDSGLADTDDARSQGRHGTILRERADELSAWSHSAPYQCRDGKTRRIPIESALFPLAYGIPERVGLLRGAGNAIVPQVAAAFVMAAMAEEGCGA